MKNQTIKSIIAAFAATGIIGATAQGAVVANWTFETNPPADLSNSAVGFTLAADSGAGTATGVHTSAGTDWTTPAGNGSANSFSANEWTSGDYYQFQVDLTGYQDVSIEWDQTRSSTGPATFDLQYSTDGVNFTTFLNDYPVLINDAINGTWSSGGTRIPAYTFTQNLSAIDALEGDASVFFRVTSQVTTAAGGTGRVDNVTISAEPVPEPTGLALLSVSFLAMLRRRRAH